MRITTNFLLKKSKKRNNETYPIYIRCTLDGQRIELSTGVYVDKNNWDDARKRVDHKDYNAKILNAQLAKTEGKINDIYNQLEALGDSFDINTIKERITGSTQHYLLVFFEKILKSIEFRVGHDYVYGTYKHYKTTRNRIKLFLKEIYKKEDIVISKIDYKFIDAFDTYLQVNFNMLPNSAGKYHKQLKKVLMDAVSMNLIDKNPYSEFTIKRYPGNRDYLTLSEVHAIEKKEFEINRVGIVRDVFVFACYTGLSYSDIFNLSKEHVVKGNDGGKWIIIDRNKTDVRCRIPLLPKAEEILDKYANFPSNANKGKLLPVNSNQKMNAYLKEIADICNIYKKLTMHVARHTFATSITLEKGVPIETVSKMLGHNSIKTTQIYGRIVDAKISNDMKKLKEKLM